MEVTERYVTNAKVSQVLTLEKRVSVASGSVLLHCAAAKQPPPGCQKVVMGRGRRKRCYWAFLPIEALEVVMVLASVCVLLFSFTPSSPLCGGRQRLGKARFYVPYSLKYLPVIRSRLPL